MDRNKQFMIIEAAEMAILRWAEANKINLYRVEFVVPFVKHHFSLSVWFFYQADREVSLYAQDGTSDQIQQQFLNILRTRGYPEQYVAQVRFFFDSDENVQQNFEGNYFYRLR